MVVDDEPFNRMSLKILFEISGMKNVDETCIEAEDGIDALEIIKKDIELNDG